MSAYIRRCRNTPGVSAGSTTQAVTLQSLTAGDDVLVATFTTGAQTITGVSDGTNTYAKVGSGTATAGTCELWAALNVAASSTPITITATWSATAPWASIWAADVGFLVTTGLFDKGAQSSGTAQSILGPNQAPAALDEMGISLAVMSSAITFFPYTQTGQAWVTATDSTMHTIGFGVATMSGSPSIATGGVNSPNWIQTNTAAGLTYEAFLNTVAPASYVVETAGSTTFGTKSPNLTENAPQPSYVFVTDTISAGLPGSFRRPSESPAAYRVATPAAFGSFTPRASWNPDWNTSASTHGISGAYRGVSDTEPKVVFRPSGEPTAPFSVPNQLRVAELVAVVDPNMSTGALPSEGQLWPPPISGMT